jgi:DNA polymerase delta subunit 3
MTEYTKYLATEILSEQRTLSYRNVARAQKVHVNAAKCMLYDFYDSQSKRKPGSVYATYLVAGTKKVEQKQNGVNGHDEDVHMPSSPPPFSSSMLEPSQQSEPEAMPVRIITLVREESLEAIKAEYDTITSLHIYSVSPVRLQDLVELTDIGRGIYIDIFVKQDPLIHNKDYGIIQNPNAKRRHGKRPNIAPASAPKLQPTKPAPGKKEDIKPAAKSDSRPSSRDSTSKPPALKKSGSSILSAFSKSQPPKSKTNSQDKDVEMSDDEGEDEDEALFLDNNTHQPAKKRGSDAKKEREDKAAKLRKLMDDDDEEVSAAPKVEDEAKKAGNLATDRPDEEEDGEGVTWSDSDTEKKVKPEEKVKDEGSKRKRGKHKVMKKKTMKDEDGYLVTKEEAVWESFSESEEEDTIKKAVKAAFPSKPLAQQSQKSAGGKGPAKKGTGKADIMSFFGKK